MTALEKSINIFELSAANEAELHEIMRSCYDVLKDIEALSEQERKIFGTKTSLNYEREDSYWHRGGGRDMSIRLKAAMSSLSVFHSKMAQYVFEIEDTVR
jgi:hypothetical protein